MKMHADKPFNCRCPTCQRLGRKLAVSAEQNYPLAIPASGAGTESEPAKVTVGVRKYLYNKAVWWEDQYDDGKGYRIVTDLREYAALDEIARLQRELAAAREERDAVVGAIEEHYNRKMHRLKPKQSGSPECAGCQRHHGHPLHALHRLYALRWARGERT